MSVRCYHWRLTSYLNENQIRYVLDEHSVQIKAFAYILHDKDVTEEGKSKTPHYHILLSLKNKNTLTGVLKWFSDFVDEDGNDINTLAKVMNNRKGAFAYLTHDTCASKHKYQYSVDDIVSYNAEFFNSDDDEKDDNINLAFNDLMDGVSLDDVRRMYGRDFIIHYSHIKALYNDIQLQTGGKLLGGK